MKNRTKRTLGYGETEGISKAPVVMLTSSREERDLLRSYNLGTNAYVVKLMSFTDFIKAVKEVGHFWGVINQSPGIVEWKM
jgi:DNA-binding NarL/FixJ family response regulator